MSGLSFRKAIVACASVFVLTACGGTQSNDIDALAKDARVRITSAMETARSTQGTGNPALWTLSDEDTTVYLFGTVHLLPDDLEWKTESFQTAFDAADTLYLEIDQSNTAAQQEVAALVVEHGMFKDGKTLSAALNDEDRAAVALAAETVGVPMSALDPAKPWFAGLQLSLVQMAKSGYNPMSGVEHVLTAEAKSTGKSFGHFETALEQVKILSGAPLDEQIEGLVFASKTIDMGTDMIDVMVGEWADGDVAGLSALMGEPSMFGSQDAYDALIVNRNKNWIPQIEAILEDPGVKFVAVGAGHLAGPDSVITMLRDKGYEIEAPQ